MLEIELTMPTPIYNGKTLPDGVKLEDSPPFERFPIRLDDVDYWIELTWNQRAQIWTANLLTAEEEPIIVGALLTVEYPPFRALQDSRLPAGILYLKDTAGTGQDPGREDLGERCRLYYLPAAEVAAL